MKHLKTFEGFFSETKNKFKEQLQDYKTLYTSFFEKKHMELTRQLYIKTNQLLINKPYSINMKIDNKDYVLHVHLGDVYISTGDEIKREDNLEIRMPSIKNNKLLKKVLNYLDNLNQDFIEGKKLGLL